MSCEGHRGKYLQHIEVETGKPAAELEQLFQTARNRPAQSPTQTQIAEAKTRLLFTDMQRIGIKPPTHSASGLPKKAAQLGYAALYDTLRSAGYFSNINNSDSSGDAARLAQLEQTQTQTSGTQLETLDKIPLWQHIPRCERCGRWLSTQNPVCVNPKCGMKGEQQGAAVPWPPPGFAFKNSRLPVTAAPADTSQRSDEPGDTAADLFDLAAILEDPANQPAAPLGVDYTFSPEDITEISQGVGAKTQARANIAAIRLLKQLQSEDRLATPDEQKILARYTGWGGLSGVFSYHNEWWKERRGWITKKPEFYEEWQELKPLMTDDEWRAAEKSTMNAHYTSPQVIAGVWHALEHLGQPLGKETRILEPAVGIGHFFSGAPESARAAHKIGIDLDDTSAAIARHLHQNADIRHCGFQETNLPDAFFDLAISNVPFGDYPVVDPAFDGPRKHLAGSIHNYFFAKALDKVKPGGTVAFITSHYTLDSTKHQPVREYLASQADFVGAMRLPNTAFQGIAKTEVTTDIIFLRKRFPHETPGDDEWTRVDEYTGADGSQMHINKWFVDNPDMMLGEMQSTGTMYGPRQPQLVSDGRDLTDALNDAITRLPQQALNGPHGRCGRCGAFLDQNNNCNNPRCSAGRSPATSTQTRQRLADAGMREGEFIIQDGEVFRVEGGSLTPHAKSGKRDKSGKESLEIQRIRGMVAVNQVARQVLRLNVDLADDNALTAAQTALNAAYDEFVQEYGPISSAANRRALARDPNLPFLLALEDDYDSKTNTARKAAIFSRRTIAITERAQTADSPMHALAIALNENGTVDWQRMSELTGQTPQQLQAALNGKAVFRTPGGEWQTADEYLSGNVRKKLADAQATAALDTTFDLNVQALLAVMPTELEAGDITASLGSGWIPTEDIANFATHLFRGAFDVTYIPLLGEWTLSPKNVKDTWSRDYYNQASVEALQIWGTARLPGHKALMMALNNQQPTIYDEVDTADGVTRVVNQDETLAARERVAKIREEFVKRWVFSDPERTERLVKRYNELFNSEVPRTYNGAHLTLPGTSAAMPALRPHQKNAIWRIMQGDNVLLGHIVGAGKTFTMIGGGMELRRTGQRKKPLYAVPNHMLDQFSADILRMYPAARVLALSSEDLSPRQQAETLSRIATGDWDAVVITHTALSKVPVSAKTQAKFLREEIDELRAALMAAVEEDARQNQNSGRKKKPSLTVKTLQKKLERYDVKLQQAQQAAAKKHNDSVLEWEDLGIDQLFVDEADQFKNLDFPTRLTRLSGVQGKASVRAFDLFMKVRSMKEKYGERQSVVFATGTPIANSISEMYTVQRYLDLDGLRSVGLHSFDAWATQFGDVVSSVEMKPTGEGYQVKERFAQFNNVPELKRLFLRFADLQMDAEGMGLQRPKIAEDEQGQRAPIAVACADSPRLRSYIADLVDRAEKLPERHPWEDNMLKITVDGRKAALDMRMVDPNAEDDPDSKINTCVNNVAEIYRNTTGVSLPGQDEPQNLTQMIFCDLGTPNNTSGGFNVYADIRTKLIAQGVAPEEIAFMQDYKTDEQKFQLFQDVNAGKVRVLLGSTETMGSGTNAQRRLVALHHLDAPWRPRDIDQREGRIVRQGNLNEEVKIYRYATTNSFDVYNWQTLERKQKFIGQVMTPSLGERSADDVDAQALSFAEMKAIATGNPAIFAKVKVDNELTKLQALERGHTSRVQRMRNRLQELPGRIAYTRDRAERLGKIEEAVTRALSDVATIEAQDTAAVERARAYAQQAEQEAKTQKTPESAQRAEDAKLAASSLADRVKRNAGFRLTLGRRTFDERSDAGEALSRLEREFIANPPASEITNVGEYLGFPLVARQIHSMASNKRVPQFGIMVNNETLWMNLRPNENNFNPENGSANVNRIHRFLTAAPPAERAALTGQLGELEKEYQSAQAFVAQEFEHSQRIRELSEKSRQYAAEIAALDESKRSQVLESLPTETTPPTQEPEE